MWPDMVNLSGEGTVTYMAFVCHLEGSRMRLWTYYPTPANGQQSAYQWTRFHNMKRFLILSGFLLGAAFLAAPAAAADDHHDKRYYDRERHDYHVYNNQEDRAYRIYLGEHHRDYREFPKLKHDQQQQYFRWRHEHSDQSLFKVEIR
jgi:hypothetical protein